eukprot:gene9732-423_t
MAAQADETKPKDREDRPYDPNSVCEEVQDLKKKSSATKLGPQYVTGSFMYLADIQKKAHTADTDEEDDGLRAILEPEDFYAMKQNAEHKTARLFSVICILDTAAVIREELEDESEDEEPLVLESESSGLSCQYVIVTGDRGFDIGAVTRVNTADKSQFRAFHKPSGAVIRLAESHELAFLKQVEREEEIGVEKCQGLVNELGLPMHIREAEYQFDKKKLSFYYDSPWRVNFQHLLRALFHEYDCRI